MKDLSRHNVIASCLRTLMGPASLGPLQSQKGMDGTCVLIRSRSNTLVARCIGNIKSFIPFRFVRYLSEVHVTLGTHSPCVSPTVRQYPLGIYLFNS